MAAAVCVSEMPGRVWGSSKRATRARERSTVFPPSQESLPAPAPPKPARAAAAHRPPRAVAYSRMPSTLLWFSRKYANSDALPQRYVSPTSLRASVALRVKITAYSAGSALKKLEGRAVDVCRRCWRVVGVSRRRRVVLRVCFLWDGGQRLRSIPLFAASAALHQRPPPSHHPIHLPPPSPNPSPHRSTMSRASSTRSDAKLLLGFALCGLPKRWPLSSANTASIWLLAYTLLPV